MSAAPLDIEASAERVLVSICVPVYNEEENIPALLPALDRLTKAHREYDFEFLFTDNASTDRTFELLADAALTDSRIRVIRFSRNYGFQRSILSNYLNTRGAAAIQIDADLQDPPELIGRFLELWKEGYKVVYGVRRSRQESAIANAVRRLGYVVIDLVSEAPIPRDAGDFRLVDRCIIEQLGSYSDKAPYLRGMIASLGYAQIGVPYDRNSRQKGVSKFNAIDVLRLGIDGICSQSTKPLFAITVFGVITSFLAVLMSAAYLAWYFLSDHEQTPGFMTLVLLVLFSLGINAACLGLLGEYIGRIYSCVRGGPLTVTEQQIDHRIEPIADLKHK